MIIGVDVEVEERKPRFGVNFEFKNEYIGLAAVTILSITAVAIVNAVCKSNLRRGSLEVRGLAKLSIGK